MKAKANPGVYSKDEQAYLLKKYGLTDAQIKALNKEKDRVEIILDFQDATGEVYKPPKSIKKYTDFKNDTSKEQQEKLLKGFGYSKTEIKNLKYEDDRVKAIMEEMEK